MKRHEVPDLRELPPNRARQAVENVLTLFVWAVWIWGAVHAVQDWRALCVKYHELPTLLSAGAGVQTFLLLCLWIRARASLRTSEPVAPRPTEGWAFALSANSDAPDLVGS